MLTLDRLKSARDVSLRALFAEMSPDGHWVGELSSSPLSTATAIATFQLTIGRQPDRTAAFQPLIDRGLGWLAEHQNPDGGWGDTVLSHSNISTSMLVYASFHMTKSHVKYATVIERAMSHVTERGGFEAIRKRYGKDHTFSVPILTQCALAGLIPWNQISPLPFELGCLPHGFFRWIRLPVVSYALPALIAIGQARHFHAPSRNPIMRWFRQAAIRPTLKKLQSIQPESGGFLEATPLTSFVTMSLVSMGLTDHPVTQLGMKFLIDSVRPDGSWPIDTDLATWVTTLSINAIARESWNEKDADHVVEWLIGQQHRRVHRYTNAAPGGWAWTNLSGGVPDADDTPGAILALLKLRPESEVVREAVESAIAWLLNLQNADGGWPTFCRGWGLLPFDRSTPDLTAHTLRAIRAWMRLYESNPESARTASDPSVDSLQFGNSPESVRNGGHRKSPLFRRASKAVESGFAFLARTQRPDGTWLPLWFGNQFASDEENPVYGVAKGLAAYRDFRKLDDPVALLSANWLMSAQNEDGGWGGNLRTPSSVEETALSVDALLGVPAADAACRRGLSWLCDRVFDGSYRQTAPIGLYFAKLWYFERLYPIIFTVSSLNRSLENAERLVDSSSVDSNT